MLIIAGALTAYGAAAATVAAVREAPRFARWYRRVTSL
jgi:hypothetical protein